jgi:SpoIID/LytB domain protein
MRLGLAVDSNSQGEIVNNQILKSHSRLLRLMLVAAVVLSLLAVETSSADAGERTIDFNGAGWGHGVGMSQYGAYGRAQAGQGYTQILKSYYTGAQIGQLGVAVPDPGELFVNVGSDMVGTTLRVMDGPGVSGTGMVFTRITGDESPPSALLRTGDTAVVVDTTPDVGASDGCEITLTISGAVTVWEAGSCDLNVALVSGATEPGHLVEATNCRRANDCTYGWGTQLMLVDNGSSQRTNTDRVGNCSTCPTYEGFDLVVGLSLDEYTRGIAEVPYSWPMEALKTQAVAARSFAASFAATGDHRGAGCFCDVKNDSSYQVFAGWIGDRASNSRWLGAADGTAGEVVVHPASPYTDIVRAYYSSSNGGASEWVKEKWGSDYAFLVSVPDEFSLVSANPRRAWTFTESADEVVDRVWGTSSSLHLTSAEVVATNVSGSAKTVRFVGAASDGSLSTKDVSSKSVNSWFGLYSWYFSIDDGELGPLGFTDIDGSIHKADIEYLASIDAAIPCDAGPNRFCPDDRMRREDLAAFMVAALDLPPAETDYFTDDNGLPFEDHINALMQAGITRGCNPPANDRFCPDRTVTRGQTAAFIVRAWSLRDPGQGNWFIDDDQSIFQGDIDRLMQAGITRGCNPPSNDKYCPERLLTRAEMSSFLARALRDLPAP